MNLVRISILTITVLLMVIFVSGNLYALDFASNSVLKPSVIASIPFNISKEAAKTLKGEVLCLPAPSSDMAGEGYPTAFKLDKNNHLHLLVPGINKVFVFNSSGVCTRSVELKGVNGDLLSEKAFLYDMAVKDDGTYLVLNQTGGWITHFGVDGKFIKTFGHIVYGSSMYLTDSQNLIVADSALSLLDIFDNNGKFVGDVIGANLYPQISSKNQLIRSTNLSFRQSVLWLRSLDKTAPTLLAVIKPENKLAKLYEASPVGFNSLDQIVVVTTEKTPDLTYYSYVQIFSDKGICLGKFEIEPNMEKVADISATWSLEGNKMITFRTNDGKYEVLSYVLPSNFQIK